MSLTRRTERIDARTQGTFSQLGSDRSPGSAQSAARSRRVRPSRGGLVLIAALICLALSTYGGEAFAQGTDKGFVKSVVSNVNAFWDKEFRLLGAPYSPANLVFIYDRPVEAPCGSFSTVEGPGYCPADETLYYPVY